MDREKQALLAGDDGRALGETETKTEARRADSTNEAIIVVPGDMDVLIHDGSPVLYRYSSGNRRMYDITLEHKAAYDTAANEQKSQIVDAVFQELLKGGSRFLRRVSKNNNETVQWQEIHRDDAANKIQQALETQREDVTGLKRKAAEANLSSAWRCPPEENHPNPNQGIKPAEDTDGDGASGDSRKKPKRPLAPMEPTTEMDEDVLSHRASPSSSDMEKTESGGSAWSAARTDIASSYDQSMSASSGSSDLPFPPTVGFLVDEIVRNLSSAVSAARMLTYLHSIDEASTRSTPETYGAIATIVDHLAGTTVTQPLSNPPSDHAVAAPTAISNNELLNAVTLLTQPAGAGADALDAGMNQNQVAIQIVNHMLLAIQLAAAPPRPPGP
jgi:hypothetical protein